MQRTWFLSRFMLSRYKSLLSSMRSQSSQRPFSTKCFSAVFDVTSEGSYHVFYHSAEQVGESFRIQNVHISVCTAQPCLNSHMSILQKHVLSGIYVKTEPKIPPAVSKCI